MQLTYISGPMTHPAATPPPTSSPEQHDAVQVLRGLMEQRGFIVAQGTYYLNLDETLPTWVVSRSSDDPHPLAAGFYKWTVVYDDPSNQPETSPAQSLLTLCAASIMAWDDLIAEPEPELDYESPDLDEQTRTDSIMAMDASYARRDCLPDEP